MKKTIIILFCCALAMACGNSDNSKNQAQKDSVASTPDASASSAAIPDEKGLELIGASDCTTCHKLREKNIGPAYSDVAEKYRNTPHAADTLVQKVIKGGSGNWGAIPMTAHPLLAEADVRVMVNYILSLKK
jgi:cytochrome c